MGIKTDLIGHWWISLFKEVFLLGGFLGLEVDQFFKDKSVLCDREAHLTLISMGTSSFPLL